MAKVKIFGKLEVRDGTGTKTPMLHTGHGSGTPPQETKGAEMRRFDTNRLMPGKTLKKLQSPVNVAYGYTGANRFVQPTNPETAGMMPGLGNTRL